MPTLLVYSDDPAVRDEVRFAIGRSPAAGIDGIAYLMASEGAEVVRAVDEKVADLLVLDGEAWPTGGLGLCRELKNSREVCPPVIVLIARNDDRWLAKWAQADAVVRHPIDAVELERVAVELLGGAAAEPMAGARAGAEEERA